MKSPRRPLITGTYAALTAAVVLAACTTAYAQLEVEIVAGLNLIVDSNVLSPSTYAPETFTVQVTYCNNTASPIDDVYAHIGNIDGGGTIAATPGIYPVRDSDTDSAFQAESPHLANTGDYSFTHAAIISDTTRYLGTLDPGECVTLYWMICYPRLSNDGSEPVWGESRLQTDDLWLEMDAWASQLDVDGSIDPANSIGEDTHVATMKSSISAMANKIGGPTGGVWTVTDVSGDPIDISAPAKPGQVIKVCGTGFRLGVDNKGFDTDQNFAFDYAVWLQPVGDKNLYDPLCYRLVRTEGQLRISRSGGNPTYVLDFVDETYFIDLPNDTNGGVGDVCYYLVAMTGPCQMALTPYQMVASGSENEKFNGDYGATTPQVVSQESAVEFGKSVDLESAGAGAALTYDILFTNPAGEDPLGLPEYGAPVVLKETIPAGTSYVAGSAEGVVAGETTANYNDSGGFLDVLYSTDGGISFTSTEPVDPTTVTHIQWWLDSKLQPNDSAFVQFQVTIDNPFGGPSPLIENTAALSFGDGPVFKEDTAGTLLTGNNSVGDTVWKDSDRDGTLNGGETGIQDIRVDLYYDVDGDGVIDPEDPLISTQDTAAAGTYSFANLPDGNFIVQVDTADTELPAGASLPDAVAATYAVDLDSAGATPTGVSFQDADWPFLDALAITKNASPTTYLAGELITYRIDLQNYKAPPLCTEVVAWGSNVVLNEYAEPPAATNAADGDNGTYVEGTWAGDSDGIDINQFDVSALNAGIAKVEALVNFYIGPNALDNDDGQIIVPDGLGGTVSYPLTEVDLNAFAPGSGAEGTLAVDITASRATWTAATFTDPGFYVRFETDKQTNDDKETAFIDAVGVRVTCDGTGGSFAASPSSIDPLPLTDTYDPARLQYVGASVTPDTVDEVGGVITWNNVGPLHAGDLVSVEVTFLALDPPDSGVDGEPDPVMTTNTATGTGALFLSGDPANDANGARDVTINPGGSIGDYLYWDVDGSGTQNAGDLPLEGVVVELLDGGASVVGTATTDVNGLYEFTALPDDTYTVRIASTNFDPGGALEGFSITADPDGGADDQSTIIIDTNDGNSSNDSYSNQDFGYDMANNLISGTLWYDYDGDGIQDPNEPPIVGQTVELKVGVTVVATATTDADGYYVFSNVTDGSYDVTATVPGGTVLTTAANPIPVDADSGGAQDGTAYSGNDFGFQPSGSLTLGDTLYVDWDGDGMQDSGEEGIENITVFLFADIDGDGAYDPATDTLVATDVTDVNGNYEFTSLATNGDYLVIVDTDDVDFPGSVSQSGDPDAVLDSMGAATDLTASADTFDFGYQPLGSGSIGDSVFVDSDGDGIHDAGEAGIADITVTLYEDSDGDGQITAADAVIATAVTDTDGNYLFGDLAPGDYLVDVDGTDPDLPTELASDEVTVLNYIPSSSDPQAVTLAAGEQYAGADFGFAPGGAIGNFVWEDLDGDGEQDDTEPPLSGLTVNLYLDTDGNGTGDILIDTTTTDADGLYFFDTYNDGGTNTGLPEGDYVVEIVTSGTQTVTYDLDGNNNTTAPVALLPGQTFGAADFGVTDSSTLVIGDTLWLDSDGDGIVDETETLLGGVKVELLDGIGTVIDTAYTDSVGNYMFGVPDDGSTYSVRVDESTLPFVGLVNTTDKDGDLDSDSGQFTMAGADVLDANFAYQLQGDYDLDGTVFNDIDSSATWESGSEPTYSDVTVYLWYSPDGGTTWINVDSQLTGPNGSYTFEGYPPGDYTVSVSPGSPVLIGTDPTTPQNQGVTIVDSDASVDFGFVGTASVGDTVFYDTDGDGVQDPGETGIPGIQVTLTYPNGQTVTTTTDSSGNYLFEGLGEGPHTITVDDSTLPAGTTNTADPDGTKDSTTLINLLEGQTYTDGNFGYQAPGESSIGDVIWADLDGDGLYEPGAGEFGIEGVVVELYQSGDTPGVDPPLATTTTDADGSYGFAGLMAGDYIIYLADTGGALDGYDPTYDEDGGIVSPDGQTPVTLATNSTVHGTADFGYSPNYASISGTVYDDFDGTNDGMINPAEDGTISGVTVELWSDPNGDGDPGDGIVVGTAVTDGDGNYSFDGLLPGDYIVVETDPSGFTSDADTEGLNDNRIALDLQGVDSTGNSFLDDGGSTSTAGGVVYNDTGDDNLLDGSGESPVAGVTVSLYRDVDSDGIYTPGTDLLIDSTVTGADGSYSFANLPDGDYLVVESDPPTATSDTDADGTGTNGANTVGVTLAGGDDLGNDFLDDMNTATVSGSSLADTGGDDTLNGIGESPIGGAVLSLYTDPNGDGDPADGEVVAVTTTGTDGTYSFGDLAPGDYVVVETQPSGYTASDDDTSTLIADGTDNWVDVNLDGSGAESGGNGFLNDGGNVYQFGGSVLLDEGDDDTLNGSGEAPLGGVEISLYADLNGNGALDPGEPLVDKAVTGSDGGYLFENLLPGDYIVVETDPPGAVSDDDTEGSGTDNTIAATIVSADSTGNSFLDDSVATAPIGGTVYADTGGDDTLNGAGETPIGGVTLTLYTDPNGDGDPGDGELVETTVTSIDGTYSFENMVPGDYVIVESDPSGFTSDADSDGANDNAVSINLDGSGTPSGGNEFLDDGGTLATIGGQVRYDTDGDGSFADPDAGVSGLTIELYSDPDGDGDPADGILLGTTTTDSNGDYSFENVADGDYVIVETNLAWSTSTNDSDGSTINTLDEIAVSISGGGDSTANNFLDAGVNPRTWDDWQSRNPLGGVNEPGDNPDGDTHSNLEEYAFLLDPESGVESGNAFCAAESLTVPGQIDAFFTRPSGVTDVTYTLEGIADLSLSPGGWADISSITPTIVDNGDGSETVTYANLESDPLLSGGTGFVRMRVDLADPATTEYTQVFGWEKTTTAIQCETYSNPFLTKPVFSGVVDSMTGSDLEVAGSVGSGDVKAAMDPTKTYFVEVVGIGDTDEGHRFEVDYAASDADTIAIDASSTHNTQSPVPDLSGQTVVLQPFRTLGEMFDVAEFNATNDPNTADRLLFREPGDAGMWKVYYALDVPNIWNEDGTPVADEGGRLIDPCEGMFVHPRLAAEDLLAVGGVRCNDFACPLLEGSNLVGNGFPMDLSFADRDMEIAAGFFTGSADPANTDKTFFWLGDATPGEEGYDSYFLFDIGAPNQFWVNFADSPLTSRDAASLFKSNRSALINVTSDRPTYVMPKPWSP